MISETYNMDCMEYMRQFPDKHFELAIVDPPYGIGEDGRNNHTRGGNVKQKNGAAIEVKANDYRKAARYDDCVPDQSYFDELYRVSKNQIIWGENYFSFNQKTSGRIVWDKVNGENDFSDCEIAYSSFHNSTRLFRFMWNGMMQGVSVGSNQIQQGNKQLNEKRIHPNHKPIILYKWLLSTYAKHGDKILDTHLGSGSSRIAAYDMGFDFYATELDKEYFEAQEKRFQQFTSQLKMFA